MAIDYDTLLTLVDDFCMAFEPWYERQLLTEDKPKRRRRGRLKLSEVITILLA